MITGRRGRDRMVVGFTTTYTISAYHHWCCEFESPSGWGVQHYVINFISDLRQNKQTNKQTNKHSSELQKWGPCRSKVWHVKNMILINRVYFVYPILWSNCNFLCFLCFVCLYLYVLDPHGCIIMQIKNHIVNMFVMIVV